MQTPNKPRRNFFVAAWSVIIGGLITVVPIGSAVWTFLDPLRKKKKAGASEMVRVTTLEALPANGDPELFNFTQDRVDAWNKFSFKGSVFIRKRSPEEIEKLKNSAAEKNNEVLPIQVLHPTCPHLGCAVGFDKDKAQFSCPCHNSLFLKDGTQNFQQCVSLRPMDELKAEIRNNNEIFIKYENFKGSIAEKQAES